MKNTISNDPRKLVGSLITSFGVLFGSLLSLQSQILDTGFNPNIAYYGLGSGLFSVAVQNDGKVVIGGSFSNIAGQTRNHLARLNNDGSLDTTFNVNANTPGGTVVAIAVQTDGKIVVGGYFTSLGGQTRNRIARLNPDGSIDTSFNPNANLGVNSIAIQSDGKILIGGQFSAINGQTRNHIARLNADGSLDTFNPNASTGGTIRSIVVESDGRILVAGGFTGIGGQTRNRIARLNADGTLDTGFNPNANEFVHTISVQNDGRILLGGDFTSVGGQIRNYIARIHSNGALDTDFNPNANSEIRSIARQADGKILVGGWFTSISGQNRYSISRLNSNGSVDSSFDPSANSSIEAIAVQSDGKILVAGQFNQIGGQTRRHLARLLPGSGISVLSGNLAFGGVHLGESSLRTFTIGNTGNAPLTVTGISYPAGFSGDWNAGSIPAGGSQNVNVTFTPIESRIYNGNISVSLEVATGVTQLAVSGTGLDGNRAPVISVNRYRTFPATKIGYSSRAQRLNISNSNEVILAQLGARMVGRAARDFKVTQPALGTLDPGTSTYVAITFKPRSPGLRKATLILTSDGPSATVQLSGRAK